MTSPRLRGEVGAQRRVRGRFHMRKANEERTTRSRRLRGDSTDAETKLWNRLRSRQIDGCKIVRQEPIGPYTVDFVCREHRLVIEVDGGQHAGNAADVVRDQWLVDHRYRVLRFWNNDVLGNIEGVLEVIASALVETPPHPDRKGDPTSPR
jgi:very-short-patch-repair endonuclease